MYVHEHGSTGLILDPYTPLFLPAFLTQDISNRNASSVLNNAAKLLFKPTDGRACESGLLSMTRVGEQKTAAASALAVGSAARLCERDSRSGSMEK